MSEDIQKIAEGLTKASKRAIVRISSVYYWTEEGAPGPSRSDAYSLWWGKDGKKKLVDPPQAFAFSAASCRWKWRLTPIGQRVSAYLQGE